MVFQHLLEQRRGVTRVQQRAFARQIDRLIRKTGTLERSKVESMIRLLQATKSELQDTIASLPAGKFQREMAAQLKSQVEILMREFAERGVDELIGAQAEFAELGQEFTQTLIRSQARRAPFFGISPELIENAATRSADLVRSLSQRQIGRVNDILNRAVITGRSVGEVSREMSREFGKGVVQMETIARTEILGIHGQVQYAQLLDMEKTSPGLRKQWITVIDERTRDTHRKVHLDVKGLREPFKVGRAELQFPRDPGGNVAAEVINCFPAGVVTEGRIVGAVRAFYRGRLLQIRTASGLELPVTPNHPILTSAGFAPAHKINKGEDLVRYRPAQEWRAGVDVYQPPARIEDVFRTLSESGAFRQPCRCRDFHGDGRFMDDDIEIVGPAGHLLRYRQASLLEPFGEVILERAPMRHSEVSGSSPSHLSLQRVAVASTSGPGGATLILDRCPPPGANAVPLQPLRLGSAANLDAPLTEAERQGRPGGTRLVRELFQRFPFFVCFDKVVEIRNFEFSGHVYDLQSEYGWIIANNIVVCNCRCSLVPDFGAVKEDPVETLTAELLPPVQQPLGGLARRVSRSVKKGFKNLR